MEHILTVSEVNKYIKDMFARDYVLGHVYMKGEVSNCKYHASGHIYFTMKDETAQMACVMFAGNRAGGLGFDMKEGQGVIAMGSIGIYERDGKYQMYAKEIRLDGLGILYERFEALKKKLHGEGLFDAAGKKGLPAMARTIGIVTSRTGAAIQDMVTIAKRRNPFIQLILYPAIVQGDNAVASIVDGIRKTDSLSPDVIIIGRGGGSIEDLWAFNEEDVARAIYECRTPVISAVGHETDVTISDYVADMRAPTPSAAMELAVNKISEVFHALADYHDRLFRLMTHKVGHDREMLEKRRIHMNYLSPARQIAQKRQLLANISEQLERSIRRHLDDIRGRYLIYLERLKGLSPLNKLSQGYSYVSDKDGRAVRSVSLVNVGDRVTVDVVDGRFDAVVDGIQHTSLEYGSIHG